MCVSWKCDTRPRMYASGNRGRPLQVPVDWRDSTIAPGSWSPMSFLIADPPHNKSSFGSVDTAAEPARRSMRNAPCQWLVDIGHRLPTTMATTATATTATAAAATPCERLSPQSQTPLFCSGLPGGGETRHRVWGNKQGQRRWWLSLVSCLVCCRRAGYY